MSVSDWSTRLLLLTGLIAACHPGPVGHEDSGESSGSTDTGSGCDGVTYAEVCFTVVPLVPASGFDVGRSVVHAFDDEPQPAIVGAVNGELYLARQVGDGFETRAVPIDVFGYSTISIGDFAGDGVVRVVVRGQDSDSIYAIDVAGQLGDPVLIPIVGVGSSFAAAMDVDDGTSLLISRADLFGTVQPWRLEGEAWTPQGTPIIAPDHLAWSFDANGDGLRDVGLSSVPGQLHPEDPLEGVRLDVLVSDGLGGFDQMQNTFEVPCGVWQIFPAELTGDGIVDLACSYEELAIEPESGPYAFVVYVAAGLGDGAFGDPEPVFESLDPDHGRGLRGFANVDGSGLPELFFQQGGQPFQTFLAPPPWSEDIVEFGFSIHTLTASDLNGDGIDDLVVHNRDGAHALLSN